MRKRLADKSGTGDGKVSPPKRKMTDSSSKVTAEMSNLPEKLLQQILKWLNLQDLGCLSQTSKQLNASLVSFIQLPISIPVLFYSMATPTANKAVHKFSISGSDKQFGLDAAKSRINFKELGLMMKKLTCLLPTKERILASVQLINKLSPSSPWAPTSQLMSMCSVSLHQLVLGWTDDECVLAARLIYSSFNSGGAVTTVLAPNYQLGSRPELEVLVKNFFFSMFFKEVPGYSQIFWIQTLLMLTSPDANLATISRVLLLVSSVVKEEVWQFGIQWSDHSEAIPATLRVASARYSNLVAIVNVIKHSNYGYLVPEILYTIFQTPSSWLPENVGSMLLFLDNQDRFCYLQYATCVCTNCYKSVTTAIIGLAFMTARARRSFNPVFSMLEEVILQVPNRQRDGFFRDLWGSLADEVTDLKQARAIGEDWAAEGSLHLFKVIRVLGQMMTEKAYMDLPSHSEEREEAIEE